MSFPGIFRRLFEKDGAGPLLRKEIIPPHADTHTADGGDPIDIAALGGASAEAFMVLQKLFDSHVKKKLTKETVFYVNGETGDDALDEGRGLSESKPFRTAHAAVTHICGAYDLQNQTCYLQLSQGDYSGFEIPNFSTTTGQLRIRGAGADRTKILGSVIFYHSASTVALESSLCVKCPNAPTPGWTNVWYGLATFAMGGVDVACTIDAGEADPSLYKYLIATAQSCKGFSLYGCTLKGACTQFLSSSGGAINIHDDLSMNGKIVGDGAIAVAVTGGRIIVISKADGASLPVISGSVEGRRYAALSGGGISVGGQGPNYFPGTEAGTVDTSTGAYYG